MEGYEKPQRLFDCQEPSNYAGLGAAGRSKRGFRALDFESSTSANSITSAYGVDELMCNQARFIIPF